ncbi:glycoside hydrolase 5 family protein [Microbacterium sp. DT81.1]|uniref:glycoside hydrolase 5 family protein n=1 Tax=Microbacterium sp. DT81.1 TaxID=3393413 RepID=UPI003CF6E13A
MTGSPSGIPRFGVNYVPSSGWWYSWVDWEPASVQRDLMAIADLGADHVRIHCLWPLFQPNPHMVSAVMLGHLESLLDMAHAAGLDVIVTVFNGWLSGFDFRPSWVQDGVSIFTDGAVIAAQESLLRAIAERIGDHPRFVGIDLANEPSVLATDTKNVTTQPEGDAWLTRLLDRCDALMPGCMHSVGMDHLPWLTSTSAFSRGTLASTGAVTPVHAWVFFTGALERYGASGVGTKHLTEYMLELAKAFARDSSRPVWLQEFGIAPEWMPQEVRDEFVAEATRISASVAGLWGITWWCSHDIDRSLGGFVELEYDLGLLTVDNAVKSSGERFRQAVADVRAGSTGPAPTRSHALVLPDAETPDLRFADHFFALIQDGIRPAIVLESRTADAGQLSERGITTLIRP